MCPRATAATAAAALPNSRQRPEGAQDQETVSFHAPVPFQFFVMEDGTPYCEDCMAADGDGSEDGMPSDGGTEVKEESGAEDEQTREEIYPTMEVLQQLKTKRSCELVLLQGWMNVESKQVKVRVKSTWTFGQLRADLEDRFNIRRREKVGLAAMPKNDADRQILVPGEEMPLMDWPKALSGWTLGFEITAEAEVVSEEEAKESGEQPKTVRQHSGPRPPT